MAAYPPQDLTRLFNNVDRDRSGRISAEELQRALSNGTSRPFNLDACRLMISMLDRDGDGTINFNEFTSLWNYIDEWTRCFRTFDRDNSGNIDKPELQQALTQFGYRLSEDFYVQLLRKFDRTGKGRVLFDDFIHLCVMLQTLTGVFREKDHDRDGVIQIGFEEFLSMSFSVQLRKT